MSRASSICRPRCRTGTSCAVWTETHARIVSAQQRATLTAQAESGPLFHLGELRIEGAQRYGEHVARNLADFAPGQIYTEQKLLDYQDRLRLSGLYEGASVTIGTDPARAAATPVTVQVREQRLHNATLGVGYSSDTGPRFSLEHVHRRPFGLNWVARNNFALGSQRKLWEFDLRSYAKPGLWHNLVAGNVETLKSLDEDRFSARLRAGFHLSQANRIPVIFVSANVDVATVSRATQAAACCFLSKPFEALQLRAAIEQAMQACPRRLPGPQA